MVTDLSILTINAKKWREENGFTGKEWIQYRNNVLVTSTLIDALFTLYIIAAILLGVK